VRGVGKHLGRGFERNGLVGAEGQQVLGDDGGRRGRVDGLALAFVERGCDVSEFRGGMAVALVVALFVVGG
jgi:hypothetical protein